jgi:uncharacterized protein DUF6920
MHWAIAAEPATELPAPAARYFERVLGPTPVDIRAARIRHRGDFLLRPGAWRAFTSVQEYSTRPPGFIWDASIRVAPLLHVRVRDSYIDGVGAMRARLGGLIPLVDRRGTPELASGALMRFLAEAVWLPTALLPRANLAWTAVDDRSARVALTDRGTSVSIDVSFRPNGEIARVAALRYRDVNGRAVLTPWVGRFWEYEEIHGFVVPREAEVEWIVPDRPMPYWRGTVVDVEYTLAE